MQIQMWEHFEKQAGQTNLDADKATAMVEAIMNINRFRAVEENLDFVIKADKAIKHYTQE